MNFLPLWTATVWPTNSGRMVERRDQVRTTFFSLAAVSTANLASRCVSVNGPFLTDLPISLPLLRLPRHDPLVGALVVARLEAARRLAPRGHRMAATAGLALAAAVRMVHRIHRDAPVVRRLAQPSRPPRLAERYVFVVHVAHLPHRGHALQLHPPRLAGGQFQQRNAALFRNQLRLRSGRARHLPALARQQF